ncbi:YiiX/YebB-like N1pC/P60 family cysteine hydrolase [Alkalihalobacillus sp. CinArs1]|uniref:YiiX/YebB-like N1pC/P60 family cysteine hydrolase n=1 Tax=Alkalihalobacillus sp. CinArs1 TaxID=2995314 RepID=UPI0022DDBEE6|nr:YiiX/YebB-like N1pC/P60 family cysteine hydrolase [Alkalihalobacillus sp. CinArs1]
MTTDRFEHAPVKKYDDARVEIITADLLLCSGSYPVSNIIKKVSNSRFSHVGLLFRWMDRVMMMESVESYGVRIIPLSHYIQDYKNTGAPYKGDLYLARHSGVKHLTNQKTEAMLKRGADLSGKRYDHEEILKILASVVMGDLRSIPNDRYICSEFIHECYKQAGLIFPDDGRGFIYPKHIAQAPDVQPLYRLRF